MALQFGSGLSVTSQVQPLPLSTIEGGDIVNATFHMVYNGTEDILNKNSTTCLALQNQTVFVKFLISLPIVFDILHPKNYNNYTGQILTDLSNCSTLISNLDINSSIVNSTNEFYGLKFELLSQNFSWAANLDVKLRLQSTARPDSLLNITSVVTFSNQSKQFNIARYRTPVPHDLQLSLNRTSIFGTPGVVLTSEEEVTFHATFQLPRITADLKLELTLPLFNNLTPMRFLRGSVLSLSRGIVSEKLYVGSAPQFRVGTSSKVRFPHSPNIAEFLFGKMVNNANASFNGIVSVEVTGIVDSMQGLYVPDSKGNITSVLMYKSADGFVRAEHTVLTLELGQPLLQYLFVKKGLHWCYEGNDLVQFAFEVRNPQFSTTPALNVSVNINILSADLVVQGISAELCNNLTVSNVTGNQSSLSHEVACSDLVDSSFLVNSSNGLFISLSRYAKD